jgi:hypothetical protein
VAAEKSDLSLAIDMNALSVTADTLDTYDHAPIIDGANDDVATFAAKLGRRA